MTSFNYTNVHTANTVVVGIVSPFKSLCWSNAKEAIVVQGGGNMSFPDLMQEIANKRNIPVNKQVWNRDEYLVTVSKNNILPLTLEQMRSGKLIRSMLDIKKSEKAALKQKKEMEKTYTKQIKSLEKQLKLVKQQKMILKSLFVKQGRKLTKTKRLMRQGMKRNRELSKQFLFDDFCTRLKQSVRKAYNKKTSLV